MNYRHLNYSDPDDIKRAILNLSCCSGSGLELGGELTGGDPNAILYLDGSSLLSTDSDFVYDGANMGLGTASPSYQYHQVRALTIGTTNTIWRAEYTHSLGYNSGSISIGQNFGSTELTWINASNTATIGLQTTTFTIGTQNTVSSVYNSRNFTWQTLLAGTTYNFKDNAGASILLLDNNTKSATFGAGITVTDTKLMATASTLTDNSGAGAGTLTNAPTVGDPTKWIAIDDNGTTRYIPTWT